MHARWMAWRLRAYSFFLCKLDKNGKSMSNDECMQLCAPDVFELYISPLSINIYKIICPIFLFSIISVYEWCW